MNPLLIIGVGFFGLVAIGSLTAGVILTRQESALGERLERLTDTMEVVETSRRQDRREREERALGRLTEGMDKVLSGRRFGARIADRLAQANLRVTVTEYIIITLLSIGGCFLIGRILFGSLVLAAFAGIFGYFLPRIYVGIAKRQRLSKFNNQLGDTINLLVNGLRSGYSMLQAVETVARELPPPVSEEFARVVQEVGLGLTNEQALNNMLRRVPSDDLDLMITAINVQHEVGGNLAEILDVISFTIRERVRIKGEIQTLTAQGQLSGYVISFLPIGMALLMFMMNRNYMLGMTRHPCGWVMTGVAVVGMIIGFIAVRKIVSIEV